MNANKVFLVGFVVASSLTFAVRRIGECGLGQGVSPGSRRVEIGLFTPARAETGSATLLCNVHQYEVDPYTSMSLILDYDRQTVNYKQAVFGPSLITWLDFQGNDCTLSRLNGEFKIRDPNSHLVGLHGFCQPASKKF